MNNNSNALGGLGGTLLQIAFIVLTTDKTLEAKATEAWNRRADNG